MVRASPRSSRASPASMVLMKVRFFRRQEVHIHSPREAARLGIEVVYQDLALADNLDVVANMFLGREWNQGIPNSSDAVAAPSCEDCCATLPITEIDMEKRAVNTLNELAVTTLRSVRLPVASLSGGQRQSVAIAKAVLWNSRVVILDEPTAALGVAQTRQVLNLVRRLAEKKLAVVVISHNLHDILRSPIASPYCAWVTRCIPIAHRRPINRKLSTPSPRDSSRAFGDGLMSTQTDLTQESGAPSSALLTARNPSRLSSMSAQRFGASAPARLAHCRSSSVWS
ncbi:MAG: sugar ABC transporter ATP-binding protein [Chloroflexi bacterium]|nr:sugar ABC transporter ATP-binding protein [Chloroflexota bacterium]